MNKPDDFDVWRLPDDGLVEKVTNSVFCVQLLRCTRPHHTLPPQVTIDQDKKVTDAVMMTLEREDHTLGNMLRMQLLDDPNVLFCGYRQKHPLEPAIQLKVQTRSPNPGPVQVVDSALIALNAELKTFKDRFETELRAKQAESQGVPGMM